jgi:hypothetical protein
MAVDYHQAAQEDIQRGYAEVALTFYRASPFADRPFWQARTRGDDLFAARLLDERVVEVGARRQALVDRVGALGGDQVTVRRTGDARLERRPVAEGGLIVSRPAIRGPRGFVEIGPVDAEALFASLDPERTVASVFEAYVERTKEARSSSLARRLLHAVGTLAGHGLVSVG